MKKYFYLLFLVILAACRKDNDLPIDPPKDDFDLHVAPFLIIDRAAPNYSISLPAHLASMKGRQSDPKKVQLGRVIFYDKNLSKDGKVACANCHLQENGFSDPKQFSTGVFDRKTPRNSMSLAATAWFGAAMKTDSVGNVEFPLFWDSRAKSVAEQSHAAFINKNEMGMTMLEIVEKMRDNPFYNWLFQQAFSDTLISEARIFTCLSHFLSAIPSFQTKFDKAMQAVPTTEPKTDLPNLTTEENIGKNLFLQHCESCHGSLATRQSIFEANNGLENPYKDKGKGVISGLFYENGTFRVPGLRNIALTAPYMHDGRFANLEAVIEHYNSGIVQVFGLHGDLLQFNFATNSYEAKRLHLSEFEKKSLKVFLETLTDETLATDLRFSNPFK